MAPLPRSSHLGRPLLELLQEQQEPFLLKVFLLEHGCTRGVVCSEATTMCSWPGNACRRLQRLARHCFKRQRKGILRSFLALFVHRRSPKASSWEKKGGYYSAMRRTSDSAASEHISCLSGEDEGHVSKSKVGSDMNEEWACKEEAKQLSPVSVLELHSDGGSPAHGPIGEDDPLSISGLSVPAEVLLDILEEFHGSAAASKYLKTKGEPYGTDLRPLLACVEGDDESRRGHGSELTDKHFREISGPQRTRAMRCRQLSLTWRTPAGVTATANRLMESDVSEPRREWRDFHLVVREIGAEIGDEIFDELAQDFVSHMAELFSRWKRC